MNSKKFSLFEDNGKDRRIEYPELAKVKEFEVLTSKEVRLCWLIGNRTSPIFNLKDKVTKVRRAMDVVYNESQIQSNEVLRKMYEYKGGDKDIPFKILAGINKMVNYNPENRLRAKLTNQFIFDQMVSMVGSVDLSSITDIDEKKKYVDLCLNVNKAMPEMIRTLEDGFGVVLKVKTEESRIKTDINKLSI